MIFTPIVLLALSGPPACAPACAIEVPVCAAVVRQRTVVKVERVRVERPPRRCRSCEPAACAPAACEPVKACGPVASCDRCATRVRTKTVVRVDRHIVAAVLPPYGRRCDCQ